MCVAHGFPPELTGGTERTVEALALALQGLGHDVVVVCGSLQVGSVDRVDEFEHRGLRVLRLHRDDLYFESWFKTYHPGVSRTVQRLLRDEQPDVVHVHHWLRLTSDLARLARASGARVVVTLHDYFPLLARVARRFDESEIAVPPPARWMSELEAREDFDLFRRDLFDELRAAHVLSAPSRAHADGVTAVSLGELGEIVTSPSPLLDVPPRLECRPQPGGHHLVTWGSIYPEKGLEVVLDAMRVAGGELSLQVFGEAHDADYQTRIEERAAGLNVTFRGPYRWADFGGISADYAVLPSLCQESYGLVVDEAQALGLPMVASDLPAYREHCQPAASAFATPGDVTAWARVLADPDARARLVRPSPPVLPSAVDAATDLLRSYSGVDHGSWRPDVDLERARALQLFRRAERRLYSALNGPELVLPPDEFLRE